MSTFNNTTYINPIDVGPGIAPNTLTTSQFVDDVVKLDGMCYTKRRQPVASFSRRDYVGGGDEHPLRPLDLYNELKTGKGDVVLVTSFIWGLQPDILPGTKSVSVSTGSTTSTRGSLWLTAVAESVRLIMTISRITIAGSYGQSTTLGSTTNNTATFGALQRNECEVLLPTGTTAGEQVLVQLYAQISSDRGSYIQHYSIDESLSTALK